MSQSGRRWVGAMAGLAALLVAPLALGQSPATTTASADALTVAQGDLRVGLDTAWVLLAGVLVFAMNAGFALLESGLCRARNCVNILAKNLLVFVMATVAFYTVGWDLLFGHGNAWIGRWGWFVQGADNSPALVATSAHLNPFSRELYVGDYPAMARSAVPLWAKFFFALVFAGTAATIVSGAVAERIRLRAFLWFSLLLVAFIYPVVGHWVWGGGWLAAAGFRDFAGSTVVHAVGGWAALAGVMVLGPRSGKYRDGKVHPIPGHNMTSATLGVLVLWLGWLGFNAGATLGVRDGRAISHLLLATHMGGVGGTLGALGVAWALLRKPDLTMLLTGALAGLVSVTAPSGYATIGACLGVGIFTGAIAVLAVLVFDKFKLDDPVGALSVHLVGGVIGTLALGVCYDAEVAALVAGNDGLGELSPAARFGAQLKGTAAVGAFAFGASWLGWRALRALGGIRVPVDDEKDGLDLTEHGNEAYPDFTASNK